MPRTAPGSLPAAISDRSAAPMWSRRSRERPTDCGSARGISCEVDCMIMPRTCEYTLCAHRDRAAADSGTSFRERDELSMHFRRDRNAEFAVALAFLECPLGGNPYRLIRIERRRIANAFDQIVQRG